MSEGGVAGCFDWFCAFSEVALDETKHSVSFGCHILHMFVPGEVVGVLA